MRLMFGNRKVREALEDFPGSPCGGKYAYRNGEWEWVHPVSAKAFIAQNASDLAQFVRRSVFGDETLRHYDPNPLFNGLFPADATGERARVVVLEVQDSIGVATLVVLRRPVAFRLGYWTYEYAVQAGEVGVSLVHLLSWYAVCPYDPGPGGRVSERLRAALRTLFPRRELARVGGSSIRYVLEMDGDEPQVRFPGEDRPTRSE